MIRVVPALLGCVVTLFVVWKGDDLWNHYCTYGNFTGRVAAQKIESYQADGLDQTGTQITNQAFENKLVLLDFWHTHCGWCFEGFPTLQAFYNKQKDNPSVAMFAVDKPLDEDENGQAFRMIAEEGYSFPVLVPSDKELPERFGILVYPTTLVLDPAGNVIYRGEINGAIALVESKLN